MNSLPYHLCLIALVLSSCAPTGLPRAEGPQESAVRSLEKAESSKLSAEQRAVDYLEAASAAAALLDSPASNEAARIVYNRAVSGLTLLLHESDDGQLWNRPRTFASADKTYRLRFSKATSDGIWDPAYFTSFTPANEEDLKTIKKRNTQDGIGAALVGVRKTEPLEAFSPAVGVTAPVTAVLDFKGNDVSLTLIDPSVKTRSRVAGKDRALEADFSAPLAYYPQKNDIMEGLMGAIHVANHMQITGLYKLQPYDPDRIPLVFVHGLISTPRMWRNVINELESDPELRGRYQTWVFAYPTGNPPLYSALRLREELAKFYKSHPDARDAVLVGHSMGGILSRTQVTTVTREDWDLIGKDKAKRFFANVTPDDLVHRSTIFSANPRIDRTIYICTPHRGSEMAVGSIGELGARMIALPANLATSLTSTLGDSLAIITGNAKRMPNSVVGLSPSNPSYVVLDKCPIEAPHHSIIGDRGKGDSPNSSDGVVKYWSSSLKSADSELIVPGPHGSCELPETIQELRRLLRLHLKEN